MILYEVLNERADVLAERTYAVWPDLEALMREHGVPQFTVDGAPPGRRVRPARRLVLHRARLHEPAHRARPRRASRCTRRTATTTHPVVRRRRARGVQPGAGRRLRRRGGPRRRRAGGPRDHRRWSAPGRPRAARAAATELLLRLAAHRRRLRAARSTTSTTCPTAASTASCRTGPACRGGSAKHTVMDLDEWPYPKKPLVPLAETRARADERRRSSAAAPAAAASARPA